MEDGIPFGALGDSPSSIFYPRFSVGGMDSWEIAPRLTMYLMASATDIFNFTTFSSGTRIKKPDVGFGVVGIKTLTRFLPVAFSGLRLVVRS